MSGEDEAAVLQKHGVDDMWGVVIETPERDGIHPIAEVTTQDPENPDRARGLFLGEDPESERQTDRTFELQASNSIRKMVTPDRYGAIAYFLSMLEQHGYGEQDAITALSEHTDMEEYETWRQSLSLRDRRLRLLDQAEERVEYGATNIEYYLNEGGSFRETGLSDTGVRVATSVASTVNQNPRRCYENAAQATLKYDGAHDVQYVEGIALAKHPGRIATHSWIEINGRVAELTWPWHSLNPPANTIYFGVPVDEETLQSRVDTRSGDSNPYALPSDVFESIAESQQSA